MMLRNALDYMGLMNRTVNQTINFAFSVGSAAVGAVLCGLAIKPFIICAAIGLMVVACLSALFSSAPIQ
jgi:hypothetical protein